MQRPAVIASGAAIAALAVLATAWYVMSPHLALDRLTEFDASPEQMLRRYDRQAVREGFAGQMLPQVDDYPPPLTKDVVLDALSHPRSVRLLVVEPFGEWQFAAAEGLPPGLLEDDEPTGSMPRLMEMTEDWEIERGGLSHFTARGADREPSNAYRFRREGLSWVLEHIELTTDIR